MISSMLANQFSDMSNSGNAPSDAYTRDKVVTMVDDHDQVWRGGNDKARFCSDEEGENLVLPALALNITTLGIPCIY